MSGEAEGLQKAGVSGMLPSLLLAVPETIRLGTARKPYLITQEFNKSIKRGHCPPEPPPSTGPSALQ